MNMFFTDSIIIALSNGNQGAMAFLFSLANGKYTIRQYNEFMRFAITKQIIGTKLYVLWNDLCDLNTDAVIATIHDISWDILTDACSRQDYSGRQLVVNYILEHELLPDHDGITYAHNQKPCKERDDSHAATDDNLGNAANALNLPDNAILVNRVFVNGNPYGGFIKHHFINITRVESYASDELHEADIHCPYCHLTHKVQYLKSNMISYARDRKFVQDSFPALSSSDRELIISGMDDNCFNELMKDDD